MKSNQRKFCVIFGMILVMGFYFNFDYLIDMNSDTHEQTGNISELKASGTYENITIDNLPGSSNNWVWAENQAWCSGLGTLENPYIIQGHTLGIDGIPDGIKISNSHDVYFKIQNCTFFWDGFISTGMEAAISLVNSTRGTIINNAISGISTGIRIIECENINIVNNTAYGTFSGIYLYLSESCEITENIVYNAENAIALSYSENNEVKNNTAYSSEYGFYITNSDYNYIYGNSGNYNNIAGIYLAFSDNNSIVENSASGNIDGIFLEDECDNNTISKNAITSNIYGIEVYYSDFNTITENYANNNDYYGITLEGSENNTISGNTVYNNTQIGIRLTDLANNNTISGNTINDNQIGISFYVSNNNTINGNTVRDNDVSGINLEQDSDYQEITENHIYNNAIGIYIDSLNANNSIYKNFFLINTKHAVDNGTDNKWNSTSIGNYWDNHTGPDTTPHDGIVDDPYTLIGGSAGSIDYLPIAEDGAPRITIHAPNADSSFSSVAPSFNVEVIDDFLFEMWYTIDGGLNNYTFTENGTIDQSAWDALGDGSVTITFYANDLVGNEAFEEVTITKSVSVEGPDSGDIIFIVVLSVVGGVAVLAGVYLYMKKRIALE